MSNAYSLVVICVSIYLESFNVMGAVKIFTWKSSFRNRSLRAFVNGQSKKLNPGEKPKGSPFEKVISHKMQ